MQTEATHPHTQEEWMKFIGQLADGKSGDLFTRVKVGYMRKRVYDMDGDSHLDPTDWGYTASLDMGDGQTAHGQGKTLVAALQELGGDVLKIIEKRAEHATNKKNAAIEVWNDFYRITSREQSPKEGPFR